MTYPARKPDELIIKHGPLGWRIYNERGGRICRVFRSEAEAQQYIDDREARRLASVVFWSLAKPILEGNP